MKFIRVHKVCSYLMVLTSLTALAVTGELEPIIMIATAVFVGLSWIWEPPRFKPEAFTIAWNVLTLLMLGRTAWVIMTGGSVIIAAIYFIIFLTVNKLFNRIASKDYLQLYVVSLLQMISATVLSTDLSFGLLFLLYIVFSTWTLIVFNLRREMESNFLFKYAPNDQARPVEIERLLNSRRLVGGRFLLTTSSISLVIFFAAGLFFFLFPRVGFRLFNQARPGISMAGFSDRVELGHFGTIKDDPTVVMRVEFESPNARALLSPYWRGISLDHYDGQSWSKSLAHNKRNLGRRGSRYQLRPETAKKGPQVKQSIYLEPMETRVVFALQDLMTIAFPDVQDGIELPGRYRAIQRDEDGDIHYEQYDEIAFRYVAFSQPPTSSARGLDISLDKYRAVMGRYTQAKSARFVQQPKEQAERIRQLATQVVGDAQTVAEATDRIETFLKSEFVYTLTSTRVAHLAPLDNFLFRDRRGHCEYFATAMVMMLRSIGIGARLVNGFLGGQWNEFGQYLAVTQGDAHSWVEVHLPSEDCRRGQCRWNDGWTARDPTPSGASTGAANHLWTKLRQYADALRMRWYKYIIEYNLETQINALLSIRQLFKFEQTQRTQKSKKEKTQHATSPRLKWVALVVLCLVVVMLGIWLYVRKRGVPQHADTLPPHRKRANELIQHFIQRYSAHGYPCSPSMTMTEYARDLQRLNAPGDEIIQTVIAAYQPARFGELHMSESTFSTLTKAIDSVEFPTPHG